MADRLVTKVDKSAVLAGLFAVWDDIDALLAGLSETQWRAPSPLPGWDVKAVVSHMIGTESFLAGIAAPEPDVDVSALEHVRNDIGAMNECWVRHLSAHADADVLESFRAITDDRRAALTSMSDEEWDAVTMTPTGPDSYGRFMRIRVFDCWMHEQDIRVALGRPPSDADLAGPAASLAVDEIAATMGYVVGKLAKARKSPACSSSSPVRWPALSGSASTAAPRWSTISPASRRPRRSSATGCSSPGSPGAPVCPARDQTVELGGDKGLASHVVQRLNFVI